MTPALEQALTVKEVAVILNVDEKAIYRLTQKGNLTGFKVAGAWRFQRSDLPQWISTRKLQTAALAEQKSTE